MLLTPQPLAVKVTDLRAYHPTVSVFCKTGDQGENTCRHYIEKQQTHFVYYSAALYFTLLASAAAKTLMGNTCKDMAGLNGTWNEFAQWTWTYFCLCCIKPPTSSEQISERDYFSYQLQLSEIKHYSFNIYYPHHTTKHATSFCHLTFDRRKCRRKSIKKKNQEDLRS